jgi:hypothetical protein
MTIMVAVDELTAELYGLSVSDKILDKTTDGLIGNPQSDVPLMRPLR